MLFDTRKKLPMKIKEKKCAGRKKINTSFDLECNNLKQ